jgi:parvulin-like peptidyl-prolyl isomerase
MLARLVVRTLLLAFALTLGGCVVTTYEGAGDPPRVPAPPERPKDASAADAVKSASDDDETFAEAPAKNEDQIAARHLLVQYKGAMRSGPQIVRTREEARQRAEEALARAKAGEDFAALVKEYSDEPGAGERGGDLGHFGRKQMVKAFADAAFGLEVGQISDVVETPFGFHVIQRTE